MCCIKRMLYSVVFLVVSIIDYFLLSCIIFGFFFIQLFVLFIITFNGSLFFLFIIYFLFVFFCFNCLLLFRIIDSFDFFILLLYLLLFEINLIIMYLKIRDLFANAFMRLRREDVRFVVGSDDSRQPEGADRGVKKSNKRKKDCVGDNSSTSSSVDIEKAQSTDLVISKVNSSALCVVVPLDSRVVVFSPGALKNLNLVEMFGNFRVVRDIALHPSEVPVTERDAAMAT